MENGTIIAKIILLGLSSDPYLQTFLFLVFLTIFLITLVGNMAIMLVIRNETSFYTPMFFFLSHLALVDICYSSVTVPKMLENILSKEKTISWEGCITQIFFFIQTASAEVFILSAMAYDRYVAICEPLYYATIMKKEICRQLVGGAWGMGLWAAVMNTVPLSKLPFCGDIIMNHYSCELPTLLHLSCAKRFINYTILFASAFFFGFSSFLPTLVSYIYIIRTILNIQSTEGRRKAFSTCSSHLIVVVLFYISAFFQYMKPSSESVGDFDKISSIQYSILTPMLNPIIYSLKNKDIKRALLNMFKKCTFLKYI